MKKLIIISISIIIASSIMASFDNAGDDLLEPLLGVRMTTSGLGFQVSTGGCTAKDNFFLKVRNNNNIYLIEMIKTKIDECELYKPEGIELFYSFSELGIPVDASYKIMNEIKGYVIGE